MTSDPKFLYLTERHREALAQLTYGVREGRGLIVVTGEVGTGKTTLLQALRQALEAEAAFAFVTNSTMPFDELLEYVLAEFGVAGATQTRAQRLIALHRFLAERRQLGQTSVLVVDDAQNLDAGTLEEIRLLSNFEGAGEKLLQIVLAGQPELHTKLELPALRQLKQRVALRGFTGPLRPEETKEYIRSRLDVAGARGRELFTPAALVRIAAQTNGIPRLVNILCDHCLLTGYATQRRRIDRAIVDRTLADIRAAERSQRRARHLMLRASRPVLNWVLVLGALVAAGVVLRTEAHHLIGLAALATREYLSR